MLSRARVVTLPQSSSRLNNKPGHLSYPQGGYSPSMFAGIQFVNYFASTLGAPKQSIALVIPKDCICKSRNCLHNAIESNKNLCPAHKRVWCPLKDTHGKNMHGPEFFCSSGRHYACDYNLDLCKSASYFPLQYASYVPTAGYKTVMMIPYLLSDGTKWKILNKESKNLYLYPYHFFPKHREQGCDG